MVTRRILGWVFGIAAAVAVSIGAYYFAVTWESLVLEREQSKQLHFALEELTQKLDAQTSLNADLKTLLQARQSEKEQYGAQVQELSSTVAALNKLASTDKQLLEKYSSVYFLNENYIPQNLSQIDPTWTAPGVKPQQILSGIQSHVYDLLDAAKKDGIEMKIRSAYRSFSEQASIKSSYTVTYGAGTANSFSADQGYSEHQLGTTVDLASAQNKYVLSGFDSTKAYGWMQQHAYEYGFVLSYPRGNSHFIFEPWHWRYVGVQLATRLHAEHKTLYDLDQRTIDTYLATFFD